MKKSVKKLVLGRETVRILNHELGTVQGGVTHWSCVNSCSDSAPHASLCC
jgi:hypothetical protein